MKVGLLYLFPVDARETFLPFAQRWIASYRKHDPGTKHKLYVAMVNGEPDAEDLVMFEDLKPTFVRVESGGVDIGAQLEVAHAMKLVDCDFLVTGTSRHYYWKPNWLKRMVDEREKHGEGLYGAMGSLEANSLIPNVFPNPHLRTVFYGFNPEIMRRYPYQITNIEQAYLFESGEWSQTQWFTDMGLQVRQVTWDGSYEKQDWSKVKNAFRRNDQSACLVRDRHTDLWSDADVATRSLWTKRAWG